MTSPSTPAASSEAALARMRSARQRDTGPEVALRARLHRMGLRYFVDRAPLPGARLRADVVFPRAKVAVFLDGCFWHGCPDHGTRPKANAAWWAAKIDANRQRDADIDSRLARAGWTVLRFWEHDEADVAAQAVRDTVERQRAFLAHSAVLPGPSACASSGPSASATETARASSPLGRWRTS